MVCRVCGNEFIEGKRGRKNSGFCSRKCRYAWKQIHVPKKYQLTCESCGETFETNNKNKKYCSVKCSRKTQKTGRTIYEKRCLYCGTAFTTIYKDQKYCTATCASRHAGDMRRGEYFCEYCGKPRHSDHPNRNRFCSRECANKARRLETIARHEEQRRQHEQEMIRYCDNCGRPFVARQSGHRYCCAECQREGSLRKSREKNQARFIPLIKVCPRCGESFSTTLRSQGKMYCSKHCQVKDGSDRYNAKRKEQMHKAFVEQVGLKTTYRAYQGICAICGLPVPATTEPANQWAATVDHISPISKGGLHKKSNCQLAHRICNSMKLDTEECFQINWQEKLKAEPGRWNEQLDDLWRQLDGVEQATG